MSGATDNAENESYELHYWRFKGRAELVRLLLEYGGFAWKYRDVVDWPKEKPATPFGQLPVLVIKDSHGGKEIHLAQTAVMARYLAEKAGLIPSDPHQRALNDALCETALEVAEHAIQWRWFLPDDKPEWKDWAQNRLETETFPNFIRCMTRALQNNCGGGGSKGNNASTTGYFSQSGKLSLVEFIVYYTVTSIHRWIPGYFSAENAPELLKVVENVEKHPKIKAYLASDRCPKE